MSITSTRLAHPRGLKVLFFTEMWERFSYYSMRALLVLYLVNSLGYPRSEALSLYGLYTGLVYLTPVLGGYLADRYFGQRQSAVIGGLLMLFGHFAMAFPPLLHLALGLLILGNGFFKPNTTAMVGQLYPPNDIRRDSAYTIFYIGINLGAFLAPLIAGSLGERIGWHWGFVCAGVGMAFALIVLLRWQHLLGNAGLREGQTELNLNDGKTIALTTIGAAFTVYLIIAAWPLLASAATGIPKWLWLLLGLFLLAIGLIGPRYFQKNSVKQTVLTAEEGKAIFTLFIISLFVTVFWMSFEQAGGTLNLFADKSTDRLLFGFEIPASWFQAINPLAIMLVGPLFAILWTRLDQSNWSIPDPAKLAFGMLTVSLSFIVMAYAQERANLFGHVGPQWLLIVYILNTFGELMLSPIGLSMVSKLAPTRLLGFALGLWFVTTAIGSYLSGVLENLLAGSGIPLYWFLVWSCAICGFSLLLITPLLKKLTHSR